MGAHNTSQRLEQVRTSVAAVSRVCCACKKRRFATFCLACEWPESPREKNVSFICYQCLPAHIVWHELKGEIDPSFPGDLQWVKIEQRMEEANAKKTKTNKRRVLTLAPRD